MWQRWNVVSENKNLWHGSAIFRSREQRIRGNVIRMLTRGTITGKSIFPGQRWPWNAWAFIRIMAARGKCFAGRAYLQIRKKSGCFFGNAGTVKNGRRKWPPAHSKWPGIGKCMAGKTKTSWRGCVAAMECCQRKQKSLAW